MVICTSFMKIFWLIRWRSTRKDKIEILLQLPFSLIFSVFIDTNMAFMSHVRHSNYMLCMALLGAGCVCVRQLGLFLN